MKPSVTIGIPALNEEASIGGLIQDLLNQETKYVRIREIIVVSDGSTDDTVKIAQSFKGSKVSVVAHTVRAGRSVRQTQLMKKVESDIFVLLDADIAIPDTRFIDKLVQPIVDGKADLTAAQIVPATPSSVIESALTAGMKLKMNLFDSLPSIHNPYHCHGPARAFRKSFYKSIHYPNAVGEDLYTYLFAVKNGYRFQYVKGASVYYNMPKVFHDHLKQNTRYFGGKTQFRSEFGTAFVISQLKFPPQSVAKALVKSLGYILTHPVWVGLYICIYAYSVIAYTLGINIDKDTWQAKSSKGSIKL